MGEAKRRKKLDPVWGTDEAKQRESVTSIEASIFNNVMSLIANDEKLSRPIFIDDIRTEEEANNYKGQLPLLYLWSNRDYLDSISISINPEFLSGILEIFCDRTDYRFTTIRNKLISDLSKISIGAVSNLNNHMGGFVKELYSWETLGVTQKTGYAEWSHLKLAKEKLRDAFESRNQDDVLKYQMLLLNLVKILGKENRFWESIVHDTLLEISYSAFIQYYKKINPNAELPSEDELIDNLAARSARMLIQDELIFGEDFSFYTDSNNKKHLRIAPEAMHKIKPETAYYINQLTD